VRLVSFAQISCYLFTLARGHQMARLVLLSRIGLKSQILNFSTPSHFVPLLLVTSFEFMEKFYGS